MAAAETITELTRFEGRLAGSDAERRTASWLARELQATGREVRLESFWCRPNWALAHAWHVALGLAGSLVSVHSPRIGGALILAALLSIITDVLLGVSPGRLLTRQRASQNVVARAREPVEGPATAGKPCLILTANLDAGRTGLVYRELPRSLTALLSRSLGAITPGWLGWLSLTMIWLLAVAVARLQGSSGGPIGVLQLLPTVVLVLALALLIDIGTSASSPAASDNGSGVAVAVQLARALDVAPPRHVRVDVILQGAGDTFGIGLRRHLRNHKHELRPRNTIVIGVAACGAGRSRWWRSDGQFVPLRYARPLNELCAGVASEQPGLQARPHSGRGATPALAARAAQLPSIAIGCLDERGLAPRSHQDSDTAEHIDASALDSTVELGLLLIDAVDEFLRERGAQPAGKATPARA
jgi:hypothetical protein